MPGQNSYLLCDFHMHTTWSDGALPLRELVDLYGRTGDFDVIAITDHILREKDWLGRAGRLATLGRRNFSVTETTFPAYLDAIREEAERAWREYELLVIPGGGPCGCLGGGQSRRPVRRDQPQALSLYRQQRLPQAEAPALVEDADPRREELGVR